MCDKPEDDQTALRPLIGPARMERSGAAITLFFENDQYAEVFERRHRPRPINALHDGWEIYAKGESPEPRPCPLCGGKPVKLATMEVIQEGADGIQYERDVTIRCDKCGIEFSEEYGSDAVRGWNRRAADCQMTTTKEDGDV